MWSGGNPTGATIKCSATGCEKLVVDVQCCGGSTYVRLVHNEYGRHSVRDRAPTTSRGRALPAVAGRSRSAKMPATLMCSCMGLLPRNPSFIAVAIDSQRIGSATSFSCYGSAVAAVAVVVVVVVVVVVIRRTTLVVIQAPQILVGLNLRPQPQSYAPWAFPKQLFLRVITPQPPPLGYTGNSTRLRLIESAVQFPLRIINPRRNSKGVPLPPHDTISIRHVSRRAEEYPHLEFLPALKCHPNRSHWLSATPGSEESPIAPADSICKCAVFGNNMTRHLRGGGPTSQT